MRCLYGKFPPGFDENKIQKYHTRMIKYGKEEGIGLVTGS